MIQIENLSCGYGKKEILHRVNAHIEKNKVTVILGPNGCGKTTLLKAIAGLMKISSGSIFINEKKLDHYTDNERAKVISFMPQMRHVPAMTVADFLMCARYPYLGISKKPRQEDYDAVDEAMEVAGVTSFKDRLLKRLSGGERQKVYFAFMLAQNTDILLLDEPTTYLDISRQYEILDFISQMKDKKKTVVMVLHDICHGLKIADQMVVMKEGCVEVAGTPEEILQQGILENIYGVKIHKIVIEGNEEYIVTNRLT